MITPSSLSLCWCCCLRLSLQTASFFLSLRFRTSLSPRGFIQKSSRYEMVSRKNARARERHQHHQHRRSQRRVLRSFVLLLSLKPLALSLSLFFFFFFFYKQREHKQRCVVKTGSFFLLEKFPSSSSFLRLSQIECLGFIFFGYLGFPQKFLSLFFSFCSFSFSLEGKKRHQKKSGRGALLLRKTTVLWHFDFERESESESERETPARVERVVWREKVLSFSFFCVFRGETRVLFVLSVFGYRIRESDWTAKKKSAAPFSFFRFVSRRLRRRL